MLHSSIFKHLIWREREIYIYIYKLGDVLLIDVLNINNVDAINCTIKFQVHMEICVHVIQYKKIN